MINVEGRQGRTTHVHEHVQVPLCTKEYGASKQYYMLALYYRDCVRQTRSCPFTFTSLSLVVIGSYVIAQSAAIRPGALLTCFRHTIYTSCKFGVRPLGVSNELASDRVILLGSIN